MGPAEGEIQDAGGRRRATAAIVEGGLIGVGLETWGGGAIGHGVVDWVKGSWAVMGVG